MWIANNNSGTTISNKRRPQSRKPATAILSFLLLLVTEAVDGFLLLVRTDEIETVTASPFFAFFLAVDASVQVDRELDQLLGSQSGSLEVEHEGGLGFHEIILEEFHVPLAFQVGFGFEEGISPIGIGPDIGRGGIAFLAVIVKRARTDAPVLGMEVYDQPHGCPDRGLVVAFAFVA